jgi:quinol monooxygenase YgiN
MIVVIAQMFIKSDERDKALQIMDVFVKSCRELSGVISVTLTQVVGEENKFIFIQEFDDETSRVAHDRSEVFGHFMGKIGELLVDTPSVHDYIVNEKTKLM